MTAPSERCVCGTSNAGTAGANPKGGMVVCCAGSVLCDGPITGPMGVCCAVRVLCDGPITG